MAALAALIFTWGAFHTATNNFYAADARSMSMSWKNFLYGSFDPAGSVTIDKLWGFLWPQAISIKIFGYHAWALALPEAIEGVISVLVLYRLTRRWTGRSDVALLSAGLFTLTPIVAATFGHSGLEDNALTMCLILATDAFQRAVNEGRLRALALSGFWIGMAFQTKMVQAWTVVPVFGLVYLICAPHPLLRRIKHTLAFGAVTVVASLWLMVIVQLTGVGPSVHRRLERHEQHLHDGVRLQLHLPFRLGHRHHERRQLRRRQRLGQAVRRELRLADRLALSAGPDRAGLRADQGARRRAGRRRARGLPDVLAPSASRRSRSARAPSRTRST